MKSSGCSYKRRRRRRSGIYEREREREREREIEDLTIWEGELNYKECAELI